MSELRELYEEVGDPIGAASANPSYWKHEWPRTDFSKHNVSFDEIFSGGPPKDGIPAVDDPQFITVSDESRLVDREAVIAVEIDGERTLAASCIREPMPGMVVNTETERAEKARNMVLELLVADQPVEDEAHTNGPWGVW